MGANRGNMAWHQHNMVATYLGAATPRVIHRTRDGIMDCYGTTVPTDGTSGYAVGCTFRQTDGDVVASGTVDSGDATSLIDATLTTTYNTNDELIGFRVVDTNKQIMGTITAYSQSTGDITVADWTDYDGTAVANTIYPAAGEAFEVIKITSPVAFFINCGDDYTGCKFNAVVSAKHTLWTILDHQTGASPQLWDDCPTLEILTDPGRGFHYFEDFLCWDPTTACGITITQTHSHGTVANDPTMPGGVIIVDTAAGTDTDGPTVQWLGCQAMPAPGTHIMFEIRVKISDDQGNIVIGLADDSTTAYHDGANIATNLDYAVFFRDDDTTDADMGAAACDGTNVTTEDDVCTDVDKAAFEKFGIHIFGDGDTAGDYVKFYHKGTLVKTITDADGGGNDGIPDAVIMPIIMVNADDNATQTQVDVDWIKMAVWNDAALVRVTA